RRQHVRSRVERWRTGKKFARQDQAPFAIHQADEGRLRSQLREKDRGTQRKKRQEQDGTGRETPPGHPRLPQIEWSCPLSHHLVRIDREFHSTDSGPPERESF